VGQITKREVRAVSLYSLGLRPDSVVWDIGAGTGSVSVEAALIAHQGAVYAIERDEHSIDLLRRNVERWAPGRVCIILGEAPEALAELPDPDAVFVGGSGGRLDAILDRVASRLNPQGRIVVNLAVLQRVHEVYCQLNTLDFDTELVMVHAARGKPISDGGIRLDSLNPVFVVTAWRRNEDNNDWSQRRKGTDPLTSPHRGR
jgi:precorrin-6Y C5,15-methyltransferase (decarboxylating)